MNRDAGNNLEAIKYAKRLKVLMPGNQDINNLMRDLSK
jgi:hypothetical protein